MNFCDFVLTKKEKITKIKSAPSGRVHFTMVGRKKLEVERKKTNWQDRH